MEVLAFWGLSGNKVNPIIGNGLKLQRSFSGLGETCQPAVSKPYRKEVLELKLQHFRDLIETSTLETL